MLMEVANSRCIGLELKRLSLLVFEQNTGAKRLYDRLCYEVVASADVVPHELIHFTGKVLLMSCEAVVPVSE